MVIIISISEIFGYREIILKDKPNILDCLPIVKKFYCLCNGFKSRSYNMNKDYIVDFLNNYMSPEEVEEFFTMLAEDDFE